MFRLCLLSMVAVAFSFVAQPARATTFVINEFVASHAGTDDHEFIELYFQSGNTDLSSFSLLVIDGDGAAAGNLDAVFNVGTTDANGYWTTGFTTNVIENGTLTILLVRDFTGTVGADLDIDDDGVLDSQPWFSSIEYDGIAVSDGGAADRTYSTVVLTPSFDGGVFAVGGASRIPDHQHTLTTADWVRNDFDGRGLPGFVGTPALGEAINTPLAENQLWDPPADPVFNEFLANHTGSDTNEFVEVFGEPDTDYSHLTVIAVEGDGASAGIIDAIYTVGTTDANGFWTNYPLATDALENGTNTFILGEGFFGSVGQDLDTNNDGTLETNPFVRTVDAVAVNDGTAGDDVYSSVVLTSTFDGGSGVVPGASRIPNGTDTDTTADWMRNDFDGDGLAGFTGTPDSTEARNTPGTKNLTAIDMEPPVITIDPSRTALWPPNHRLTEVCITVEVSDEREPAPTYVLTSVTSNEPADGKGDGHTPVDIQNAATGTPDLCFSLRAERSGGGEGREYTIVYTATDGAGNTSTATTVVSVPHDQSGNALASTGFDPEGVAFSPGAESFAVIIPSRLPAYSAANGVVTVADEGLDAAGIEPHFVFVGNTVGALRPDHSTVADMNGDGLEDLVVYFDVDASLNLDPRRQGKEGAAMLGLHFESPDGTQILVENIFELGKPLSPETGGGTKIMPELAIQVPKTSSFAIQPNPFNPTTTISIELAVAGNASVRVFDVRGALVKTLKSGALPAGQHDVRWDGRDDAGVAVASGVYFVRLETKDVRMTKRAVLLK